MVIAARRVVKFVCIDRRDAHLLEFLFDRIKIYLPMRSVEVTGATRDSVPVYREKKAVRVYKRLRTKGRDLPDRVGDGVTVFQ